MVTLGELTTGYLTWGSTRLKPATLDQYGRLLSALPKALLATPLDRLTGAQIEDAHTALADRPFLANRTLAAISSALQFAQRRKLVAQNVARGIPRFKERSRDRYLSPTEMTRLLATLFAAYERWPEEVGFIRLVLFTGARPGELKGADWSWVRGGALQVPDAKRGPRTVYLSEEALRVLYALPSHGWASGQMFRPSLDYRRVWERVRRVAKIDARLYDLRRTFASAGLAAGLSLEVIGQLLGHTDPRSTKVYARMMTETGERGAAAAGAYLNQMGAS